MIRPVAAGGHGLLARPRSGGGPAGAGWALRAAGAQYGVRVSVLCPGIIDTLMMDGAWAGDVPNLPRSAGAPASLREFLQGSGTAFYPVNGLAEQTLAGLGKNRAILVLPRRWRSFWTLGRLAPAVAVRLSENMT